MHEEIIFMVRLFAAIDVGSFELELGIYEMSAKTGIHAIDHVKHTIALGKDTYNKGKISYGLVEEMCQVLLDFSVRMKTYQVENYRAYATSAMREAKNSQIILDQIRVRTGIDVKVISNSEQRFISYKAIASKDKEFHKIIQKGTAIVDVGFGSMQVSLFDQDSLVVTQNMPLGVLRLWQMMNQIPTSAGQQQNIILEIVDHELLTLRKMYLKDQKICNLIGIGDAILTLYKIMNQEAGDSLNGRQITGTEFQLFYDRIRKLTPEQIEESFGIPVSYAAMLMPTADIYKRLIEMTGAGMIWIPGIRLIDGIVAEYAENKKILAFGHSFEGDIIAAARNMAKRYKSPMAHIEVVESIVLEVFDNLKKFHGLKARERLLLQIAANLHSCGKFISMRNSPDCGYNIIMSNEIIGLSHLERAIVANVVRYNIKEFRYNQIYLEEGASKDSSLAAPDHLTLIIAKLTAILRLANCIDRSHKGKLQGCRIRVKENHLLITTDYSGDITLEQMTVFQCTEFFEEIYGLRPVLRQKRKV